MSKIIMLLAACLTTLSRADGVLAQGPDPVPSPTVLTTGFDVVDPELGVLRRATAPPTGLRSIRIPGSAGRVVVWSENGAPYYAVSLDGRGVSTVRPTSYDLLLRYAHFDPLRGEPAVPPALAADPGSGVHLVQFVTQPLEAYRAAIEALGGTVAGYVGNHAFIVRSDVAAAGAIAAQPFVRWVGPFHPAYRLEEPLLATAAAAPLETARQDARRYSILALPGDLGRSGGDTQALAAALTALGARIDLLVPDGDRLEATLTPAQLLAAARLDDVLFIDRWKPPTTYMNFVREVGGADDLERVAGYTGAGVRAEVMDSNLYTTHPDFQRHVPIIHGGRGGSDSHGTSVFGIVFGTGANNPLGRGMLPDAQGIFADFGNLTDRPGHIARLVQAPYYAVFQTNSWGSCCFTGYTTQAAAMDTILFQNDFLLLQAQANTGSMSSDAIAFAKNLVSVGGIRHFNTAPLGDDRWQNAGSIGPASDGRIKPDLAFWYDGIFTTATGGGYTSGFGGTSAATPMTAGHFGLFYQMWAEGIFGNAVTPGGPGGTVFENRPHMSTAKAMMINTATPYPFTGPSADLTRTHQGWGRPDVRRLHDLRDRVVVVNETDVLTNLGSRTYELEVAPGTPELRATLVYTDPAGTPNSSRHRVNDLTLRVVAPDGAAYWGNNGLREGNASTPGGNPNVVDTVENVWVTSPMPGNWTVEVQAPEIVQDQHLETPAVDADFALVVSGVNPLCPADCDQSPASPGVDLRDFLCFLNLYAAGAPGADFNGDGQVTVDDFLAFLDAFAAGCA